VTQAKSWKLKGELGVVCFGVGVDDDPVAAGCGEEDLPGDVSVGGDVGVVVLDVAVVAADDVQVDAGVRLAALLVGDKRRARGGLDRECDRGRASGQDGRCRLEPGEPEDPGGGNCGHADDAVRA
jgi:hypothetical protein